MGLLKSDPRWNSHNLYVDYDFEEVMYRWDFELKKVFCKFYGMSNNEEQEVSFHQRLFTDAIMYGNEISKEEYEVGKLKND